MDSPPTRNDGGTGVYNRLSRCYANWMLQLEQDLEQLCRGQSSNPRNDVNLRAVIQQVLTHFQDYLERRWQLAGGNVPVLFSPSWCATYEKALLWMGGCRPSMFIRLVLALCGLEAVAALNEYMRGVRSGNLGEINAHQMNLISMLQSQIVMDEKALSSKLASLQESIGDDGPLMRTASYWGPTAELSMEVERAMEGHVVALREMVKEADMMRVGTLKQLIAILTPFQGVDLLIATNKLHLSLNQWGRTRDQILANTNIHP